MSSTVACSSSCACAAEKHDGALCKCSSRAAAVAGRQVCSRRRFRGEIQFNTRFDSTAAELYQQWLGLPTIADTIQLGSLLRQDAGHRLKHSAPSSKGSPRNEEPSLFTGVVIQRGSVREIARKRWVGWEADLLGNTRTHRWRLPGKMGLNDVSRQAEHVHVHRLSPFHPAPDKQAALLRHDL